MHDPAIWAGLALAIIAFFAAGTIFSLLTRTTGATLPIWFNLVLRIAAAIGAGWLALIMLSSDPAGALQGAQTDLTAQLSALKIGEPSDTMKAQIVAAIIRYGLNILGAIVVLIVGWSAAAWIARLADRALRRMTQVDRTLRPVIVSMVRYALIAITILAVLNQFGVQTTSLVALLGAAGLGIGLALQGTLSNVASGFMLLMLRPFQVDDYVEIASHEGTVERIGLFLTELKTVENKHVSLPNAQVFGAPMTNYTRFPSRRFDLIIGIDYAADIDEAIKVISDVLKQDERILSDPSPQVAVSALGASSVDLVVRAYTPTTDYLATRWDMIRRIKYALDAASIVIPFPQSVVSFRNQLDIGASAT